MSNWNTNLPCKKAKIQVAFHLVHDAAGNGGYNATTSTGVPINTHILQKLNTYFNLHNIEFVLKQGITPMDNINNDNFTI